MQGNCIEWETLARGQIDVAFLIATRHERTMNVNYPNKYSVCITQPNHCTRTTKMKNTSTSCDNFLIFLSFLKLKKKRAYVSSFYWFLHHKFVIKYTLNISSNYPPKTGRKKKKRMSTNPSYLWYDHNIDEAKLADATIRIAQVVRMFQDKFESLTMSSTPHTGSVKSAVQAGSK